MVESIVTVLMRREGLSKEEAQRQKNEFRGVLQEMLEDGCDLEEITAEFASHFALEPDYLEELIF